MKDEMNNELKNKVNEENLEEVTGGLNDMHLKVGGYADSPAVVHPVLNSDTDAANVHPIMKGQDKYVPTHPVMKGKLGQPVLIDTNSADNNGNHGTLA